MRTLEGSGYANLAPPARDPRKGTPAGKRVSVGLP